MWAQAKADAALREEAGKYLRGVLAATAGVELTANEAAACTSLAYNIGLNAFSKSTLVRKLVAGDRAGAAEQFLRWNKAGGRVMPGLTNRRQDERRLFVGSGGR